MSGKYSRQKLQRLYTLDFEERRHAQIQHWKARLPDHKYIGAGSFNMTFQCPNPDFVIKIPHQADDSRKLELAERILRVAQQLNPHIAQHIKIITLEIDGKTINVVSMPYIEAETTDQEQADFALASLQQKHRFVIDMFSPGNLRKTTNPRWLPPGMTELFVIVDVGLALDLHQIDDRPASPTSASYWGRSTWNLYTESYWPRNVARKKYEKTAKVLRVCSRILDVFGYKRGHEHILELNTQTALIAHRIVYEWTYFINVLDRTRLRRQLRQAHILAGLPEKLHRNNNFYRSWDRHWDTENTNEYLQMMRTLEASGATFCAEFYITTVELYPGLIEVILEIQKATTPVLSEASSEMLEILVKRILQIAENYELSQALLWAQKAKGSRNYTTEWISQLVESAELWKGMARLGATLFIGHRPLLWEIYASLTENKALIVAMGDEKIPKLVSALWSIIPEQCRLSLELLSFVQANSDCHEIIQAISFCNQRASEGPLNPDVIHRLLFNPTTRNTRNLERYFYLSHAIKQAKLGAKKEWQKGALRALSNQLNKPLTDEAYRIIALNLDYVCSYRHFNCSKPPQLLRDISPNMTMVRESFSEYPLDAAVGGSKSAKHVGCQTKKMWQTWLKGNTTAQIEATASDLVA